MEKLLVVGASGLLGRRLVELGKGAYEVHGTYNSNVLEGRNFYHVDVTNREAVTGSSRR